MYQIFISSKEFLDFWMIIEMRSDATLEDLDWFLRCIWVECCDHLSMFKIENTEYYQDRQLEAIASSPFTFLTKIESANIPIGKVLREGTKFTYIYDFGSSTELELKVISTRMGTLRKKIRLLARNYPPNIKCNDCDSEAKYLIIKYEDYNEIWEFYCEKCIKKHEDETEMIYPILNSPRIGKCGYDGEETPLVNIFELYEWNKC
ncbi:MAG: IS1096 element passenger TnpR family protein [Candidatus Njordarchaeia archaeon]